MKFKFFNMYSLRFIALICFLFMFNTTAFAAGISRVSSQKISVGDTFTIYGSGFGVNDFMSGICWEGMCVADDNIQSWSDTKIVVSFSSVGMPTSGQLEVLASGETIHSNIEMVVNPVLTAINGSEELFFSPIIGGEETTIEGYYFGDSEGILRIGDYEVTDITVWSDSFISFTAPILPIDQHILTIVNTDVGRLDFEGLNAPTTHGGNPLSPFQTYLISLGLDASFIESNSEDIIVAIIDSGVQLNHEDLSNNILRKDGKIVGYNFIDNSDDPNDLTPNGSHGTAIAGIIAAEDNNIGIVGIAPSAKIMPLLVSDEYGHVRADDIIEAIYFAVDNGAHIINISLGFSEDYSSFTQDFDNAIRYAQLHDVIIVVAATNGDIYFGDGANLDLDPVSPLCNDLDSNAIIGVGGVDYSFQKTHFSDFGNSCIDFSAIAENIYTIDIGEGEGHGYFSGNSFAAAQVSGAIAKLLAENPSRKPWEVLEILEEFSVNIDELNPDYAGKIGTFLYLGYNAFDYDFRKGLDKYAIELNEYKISNTRLQLYGKNFNDGMLVKLKYYSENGEKKVHEIESTYTERSWKTTINLPDDFSEIIFVQITRTDGDVAYKNLEDLHLKTDEDIPSNIVEFTGENRNEEELLIDYPDVSFVHKNVQAIEVMKALSIMEGYPDGTFGPDKGISRAELMKVVTKAMFASEENFLEITYEPECFPDVHDEWFAQYVCFAKEQGWIGGYPNGTFGPARHVNKAEGIKIILEIFGYGPSIPKSIKGETGFQDVDANSWYAPYVFYAYQLNILQDKVFLKPSENMTRAEAAEIIFRLLTIKTFDLNAYESIVGTQLNNALVEHHR